MSELSNQTCVPCEGGVEPLTQAEAEKLNTQVKGWVLTPGVGGIEQVYTFPNFVSALAIVNSVGALAEREGHHPDVELGWGRVKIALTTHAIKGLSINDFVLASKIDEIKR